MSRDSHQDGEGRDTAGLRAGVALRPLFELHASVGSPVVGYQSERGLCRIVPVLGGTFEGERIRGILQPGGADHQLIRPDGIAELDVRLALLTDDGASLYMTALGVRTASAEVTARIAAGEDVDPSLYYFREALRFETGDARYAWMNGRLFVGSGVRRPDHVGLSVHEVL
jgi:hypothetical protein